MPTKVLIDTNIYAAHEMGYPDAVEFIEQLIEDEAEIIMTTLIEMEIMSHFYDVTREDTELAADMRRKAGVDSTRKNSIKAPDALVAAAALIHNAIKVKRAEDRKTESHAMTLCFYKSRQSSGSDSGVSL